MTCRSFECKSKSLSGENNPYWGKVHDEQTRERIKAGRRARPPKNTGPKKGTFKHSPEARAKMSAAVRERWRLNRDKMLERIRDRWPPKPREDQRYRKSFTPGQRREWKEEKCRWCDSTADLILDHIIPVMCGGMNEQRNAQTLCQPCNLWKAHYIDRNLFLAGLGSDGG